MGKEAFLNIKNLLLNRVNFSDFLHALLVQCFELINLFLVLVSFSPQLLQEFSLFVSLIFKVLNEATKGATCRIFDLETFHFLEFIRFVLSLDYCIHIPDHLLF